MHLHLTPELRAIIERRVKSGKYASAGAFVRDLIRDAAPLDQRPRPGELKRLKADVKRAIAALDAGRGKTVRTARQLAAHLRNL
ncbi:MAG: hypothetical protein SFV19_11705 [Rhodospirillaceae bacterium]|nr:hypothetical protein [Rhodospirillaceae bacterium]